MLKKVQPQSRARIVAEFKETKYFTEWHANHLYVFCNVCFSGFLFDILSVSIKSIIKIRVNLWVNLQIQKVIKKLISMYMFTSGSRCINLCGVLCMSVDSLPLLTVTQSATNEHVNSFVAALPLRPVSRKNNKWGRVNHIVSSHHLVDVVVVYTTNLSLCIPGPRSNWLILTVIIL